MSHLTESQLALVYREIALPSGNRIVLLDVGGRRDIPISEHNRNIYCITPDGEIAWQIQAIEPNQERDSFVSLSQNENGEICADRFFGTEFALDPETGAAKNIGWHK